MKQKDDWEIDASEIEFSKRADGSDWVLGDGAFGQVCTPQNCPIQSVNSRRADADSLLLPF